MVQRAVSASGIPAPARLRAWARAALDGVPAEVTLRIVGAAESRALNRRWRGKDRPTNVLSFPYDPPGDGHAVRGDLVLCAPLIAREARAQRKALAAHWAHLVVHGILHLLGHDHEQEAEARRMENRERKLLAALAFPDPYLPSEP